MITNIFCATAMAAFLLPKRASRRRNDLHSTPFFDRNTSPPAELEVGQLLAPQRGLSTIAPSKTTTEEDCERQPPGTVKLWETPGRAGGLPR
jgi:hypothetical protein